MKFYAKCTCGANSLILYSNNLVICPEMLRFYLLQGKYNIIICFGLLLDINTYFEIRTNLCRFLF